MYWRDWLYFGCKYVDDCQARQRCHAEEAGAEFGCGVAASHSEEEKSVPRRSLRQFSCGLFQRDGLCAEGKRLLLARYCGVEVLLHQLTEALAEVRTGRSQMMEAG